MKKVIRQFVLSQILLIVTVSITPARIGLTSNENDLNAGISASAWLEAGQFVRFWFQDAEATHQWVGRSLANLTLDAVYKERMRMIAGVEAAMWFDDHPHVVTAQDYDVHMKNYAFYIAHAEWSYAFGDTASPFLSVGFGTFPFKYNPQVRNLGEYLFRSGTYPAYLINEFDFAQARLTGLKLSSTLLEFIHQDLLLTVETQMHPFHDISLSYLLGIKSPSFVDFGAGVSFAHLISVNDDLTTPKSASNMYLHNVRTLQDAQGADSIAADTGYYSFSGIKLMGRLTLDPKAFIKAPVFGPEDLKVYAEAAILGVKSYPANYDPLLTPVGKNPYGYDTLANKIPFVIGFNLPAFKLLDVLAVELEWYRCPYPNSYQEVMGRGTQDGEPLPSPKGQYRSDYHADDMKWSVYARKIWAGHFGITAQVARDHIRTNSNFEMGRDRQEALGNLDHWWWAAKLMFGF